MLRRSLFTAIPALTLGAAQAAAERVQRLVVVELFTSQSCSSCPPADAVLTELARDRADVLPLSFHVTYWNRLGWRDRFSLQAATDRQRRYGETLGHGQIYTPQIVVQGRRDVVGSNRAAVLMAIRSAEDAVVPIMLAQQDQAITVEIGEGAGEGTPWLIGYDLQQATAVGGGENGGRRLSHSQVVRSVTPLGEWRGGPARLVVARPEGERVAVLLQAADGAILGAART